MQRRTFCSRLAMIAVALVMTVLSFGGTTTTASAQIVACAGGTYTVDLSALPNPACYPFKIRTSWAGGAIIWPGAPYPGPGIYVESPGVPPGKPLDFVDVFGVRLPPTPLQKTVNTPCGPVCVTICLDGSGCLYIKIYPGPCPAAPLPCP